jgi:hypothetical protein
MKLLSDVCAMVSGTSVFPRTSTKLGPRSQIHMKLLLVFLWCLLIKHSHQEKVFSVDEDGEQPISEPNFRQKRPQTILCAKPWNIANTISPSECKCPGNPVQHFASASRGDGGDAVFSLQTLVNFTRGLMLWKFANHDAIHGSIFKLGRTVRHLLAFMQRFLAFSTALNRTSEQ